jgi:hypothetical protein
LRRGFARPRRLFSFYDELLLRLQRPARLGNGDKACLCASGYNRGKIRIRNRLALDFNVKAHGENFTLPRDILNNIANTYAFAGHETGVIAAGEKALALERAALGPHHGDTIWYENNLADYYHRAGRLADAEATYRDTLTRARATFTHGEWDPAHFEFHLGQVLGEEGKNSRSPCAAY